jgi:hypothetical protein
MVLLPRALDVHEECEEIDLRVGQLAFATDQRADRRLHPCSVSIAADGSWLIAGQ